MSGSSNSNLNPLGLSKIAYNIYGNFNQSSSETREAKANFPRAGHTYSTGQKTRRMNTDKVSCVLTKSFDHDISCVEQLNYGIQGKNRLEETFFHLLIGGKNHLKLYTLNHDQNNILGTIDVLNLNTVGSQKSRVSMTKFNNVNALTAQNDTIAFESSTGSFSIFKIQQNGKSYLLHRLSDHKRSINSLSFVNQSLGAKKHSPLQIISGSQDGTIKLWDIRSNLTKPVVTISPSSHSDPVRCCEYSPHSMARNKQIILAVYDSGSLCKFDLRATNNSMHSLVNLPERKWNFHSGPALSLNIHPEREFVVTGGRDQRLCIFNYSDYTNVPSKIPDYILNTYGPVLKVRWCENPRLRSREGNDMADFNERYDDKFSYADRESYYGSLNNAGRQKNDLMRYDIACMFLNDDPTITIYNLQRKYIPREIIWCNNRKGFQNFVWAQSPEKLRRLWAITKSRKFSSFDLDLFPEDQNITQPLENFSSISTSWNTDYGNLCFVNQDKYEFENIPAEDIDSTASYNDTAEYDMELAMALNESLGSVGDENSEDRLRRHYSIVQNDVSTPDPWKLTQSSVTVAQDYPSTPLSLATSYFQNASAFNSPQDKYKGYNKNSSSFPKPHSHLQTNRSSVVGIESVIEGSFTKSFNKPSLVRNFSQSTHDSGTSGGSFIQSSHGVKEKKIIPIRFSSPYIMLVSLPLPLNDEQIFEALSENYLQGVPKGSSLIDACLYNANVAASLNRLRDCQVWRILGESLNEEEEISAGDSQLVNNPVSMDIPNPLFENKERTKTVNAEGKSINSELGNVVGSYNSYSTHSTNYGTSVPKSLENSLGIPGKDSQNERNNQNESSGSSSIVGGRSVSSNNLLDMIYQNRKLSMRESISPTASRSNSGVFHRPSFGRESLNMSKENENAIEDDSEIGEQERDKKFRSEISKNECGEILDYSNSSINTDSKKRNKSSDNLERRISNMSITDTSNPDIKKLTSLSITPPRNTGVFNNESAMDFNIERRASTVERTRSFFRLTMRSSSVPKKVTTGFNVVGHPSEDLDNENMMLMNNAGFKFGNLAHSPGNSSQHHPNNQTAEQLSYGSSCSSHRSQLNIHLGNQNIKKHQNAAADFDGYSSSTGSKNAGSPSLKDRLRVKSSLNDISEMAEYYQLPDSTTRKPRTTQSELTKGIQADSKMQKVHLEKLNAWRTEPLLVEAIEYASLQGNILLCATLVLLFYEFIKVRSAAAIITKEKCIDWIWTYTDVLRRHQLFIHSSRVMKNVPAELLSELQGAANSDVKLRFYCCWCQKLLTNENSKLEKGVDGQIGYWYCDKCNKAQMNCVYCNEPCRGINVVISLACGHRGHFGCLKEWFVEGQNTDCPGGCCEEIL